MEITSLLKNTVRSIDFKTGNEYYEEGISLYNSWHKIFDDEYYNILAYQSFRKAMMIYIEDNNNTQIYNCFKYMILCLCNLENKLIRFQLGILYEKFGDFLQKKGPTFLETNPLKLEIIDKYDKSDKIYYQLNKIRKVVSIKRKKLRFYGNCMSKNFIDIHAFQKISAESVSQCKNIFEDYINSKDTVSIAKNFVCNINSLNNQLSISRIMYEDIININRIYEEYNINQLAIIDKMFIQPVYKHS